MNFRGLVMGGLLMLTLPISLLAQESPLFETTRGRLISLEADLRTASSDLEIVELLIQFQEVLAEYLASADSQEFLAEIRQLDPLIEAIGHRSHLFYHRFRPYKFSHAYTVEDPSGNIVVFTNTYRSNEPLSEQEKSQLFFLEMNSYQEFGIHPRSILDEESLEKLVTGQVYNFVVTSDKITYYAPEDDDPTLYLTTDQGISIKRIRSPNHTILAGNQPVLSAGTFVMWKADDRKLFFVANNSGHFRPDYESLQVFKEQLVSFGLEPEGVICLAIEVEFERVMEAVRRKQTFAGLKSNRT